MSGPSSSWWWIFGLLVAAPALLLVALGLRAAKLDRVEWDRTVRDRQMQTARLADAGLDAGLARIEAALRPLTTGNSGPPDTAVRAVPGRPFLVGDDGTVTFVRERVYFAPNGGRGRGQTRRSPAVERLIADAQSAEAQGRHADASARYGRVSRAAPDLADWARLASARVAFERGGDVAGLADERWSLSELRTLDDLPVAVIAAAHAARVPPEGRAVFRPLLERTLQRLCNGSWSMSFDERRFYEAELRRLLETSSSPQAGTPPDTTLDELRAIYAAIGPVSHRLDPSPARDYSTSDRWSGLILRVATETGGRGWVGAALDANSVGEVVGEALQPLTTGDYTVALRDGGGRSLWASEPGAAGMSLVNPLRAVAGWELAFGAPVPPDAVVRRRSLSYALVGLLASMLVAGLWVTARGRAQELALAKRQADFVAAVSHELKSPLTSIRLYTERLSSGRATATEAREYFATVDSEAGRLERLVNRLLVSQRMQEGRHAYVFKPGSLADVARTAIARLQAQARARRVTLELRETGSTATTFDCAAITDAIENLAENAIKYSPEHSSVVVSIASGGEHVSVEVADCGVGIDEADLPHIFEKFFRGRRGDRADVRGTGLGLSLVKAIVDAHDGAIEVTSVPGEGSRFVVRLPRRTASAPGVAV